MKNVKYFGVGELVKAYLLLHSTINHCRIWFLPAKNI